MANGPNRQMALPSSNDTHAIDHAATTFSAHGRMTGATLAAPLSMSTCPIEAPTAMLFAEEEAIWMTPNTTWRKRNR